jgi:hypothetical protein
LASKIQIDTETLICYRSAIDAPLGRVTAALALRRTSIPMPSKLTPEQWVEARRLRAGGASYADIASRFGVRDDTICRRARREGWSEPAGTPAGARRRPATVSAAVAGIRSRLALRLYNVIECKIRMMELRMHRELQAQEGDPEGGAPSAPTKDERESFAALIQSINQVTEMASDPASAADGRRKTANAKRGVNPELTALSDDIDPDGLAVASEKDQYRRELAEHLGRMFAKP